ncbi:hypothetical protein [Streptomyces sp. NPDC021020]|uniref:hypothetical protein n=1 Tax=Streptomyces sp. NPDC021020 TaxID=3365109 RepID=UPI00378FADD1
MSTSDARQGRRRRRRALSTFVALLVLAAAAYVVLHGRAKGPEAAGCKILVDDSTLTLTQSQAANAATIAAVAAARALPERAVAIALATAIQESRLDNLDHGDRDSLGLFQQRPSQGWGTAQQILDPVYSSTAFYKSLVKIHDYQDLPLTVAAQKVQRSGYPEAYAQHEEDATLLAAALVGRKGGALSCTTGADRADSAGGAPGSTAAVTAELQREFGALVRPAAAGKPAVTVTVPAAPASSATAAGTVQRGWQLAQWSVAHAPDLKLAEVWFGGVRWQAAHSGKGWVKVSPDEAKKAGATDGGLVRITVAQ